MSFSRGQDGALREQAFGYVRRGMLTGAVKG
jgi:hypothetical protein